MLPKPQECEGCPLYTLGSGFSHPTGNCTTGVLLMGEALGATEAQRGVPFVGEAGAQLNRTLSRTPWTRDDFRLYNVLQCQPPKNWLVGAPWEEGAIEHCTIHRNRIITETRPKVVVALGGTALATAIGAGEILKRRGYVYGLSLAPLNNSYVVGTYHPSYIMQGNQNLTGIQVFDILRAVEVAKNGWEWQSHDRYVELPSLDDVDQFINLAMPVLGGGGWLTADIETARSATVDEDERSEIDDPITRISFAFEPGHAISIPWRQEYLSRIQDLLNLPRTCLAFWNADFDVPRLKAHGMEIRPKIVDSMYMWHFLQSDLPKSLGFVATLYTKMAEWKSLASQSPTFYSCCDADAQIQCTLGIRRDLERQGRFDRFMRHHTELQPILTEMGQSGVLLDMKKREEFRGAIEEDRRKIDREIQLSVPNALRPFKVRRKVPPDAVLGQPCRSGGTALWSYHPDTGEWGELADFLYNSSQQVLKYIRSQGHAVPRNYKTGKDTTGKDDLESLARRYPKDPVYRRIIEARELHKVIGQYIDGYKPGNDGRVRTTFTQKPSTWRLASEGPNVQNVRRRWHLANRYREQFVAAPGHVLVEADYCVAPDVKILKSDLTWVPAISIKVGDRLIAFDEHQGKYHGGKYRESVVISAELIKRPTVKVHTTQGNIVVSREHRFLGRYDSCKRRWTSADKLRPNFQLTFLCDPWSTDESHDGGYLAGFFDGEGWVSNHKVGFGQNEGPTLEYVQKLLQTRGFQFRKTTSNSTAAVYEGNTREALRFLGMIRPPRLLPKAKEKLWNGKRTWGPRSSIVKVLKVEPQSSEDWVVAIETTTGTLITDGYFSHNCAIEAVLTGWYAQDQDYIRAAKLGVHSILAATILNHTLKDWWTLWPDADVRRVAKELKRQYKQFYDQAKTIVHLSNYRGSARRIKIEYPDLFKSVAEAEKIQNAYFTTIAKSVRQWQDRTIAKAAGQSYLDNAMGYRHYFYDVLRYDGTYGTDAKKALAFLPQSTAAAIIKEAILRLAAKDVYRRALRWQIHDALLFELPNDRLLDSRIRTVVEEMTCPIPELDGLVIDVEVKVGENWGEMREWPSSTT